MDIIDLVKRGSQTAKGGFKNEDDIIIKFKSWQTDTDAQKWLEIMGYSVKEIERVEAVKIPGHYKADIQVQIIVYLKKVIASENLSIKLVSNTENGFNQVDKRKVDKYADLWKILRDVVEILKLFTGETTPTKLGLKDKRRMSFKEMDVKDQEKVTNFFATNKILIVSDILKGREKFPAAWMLVALIPKTESKWVLKPINQAMNIFGSGEVRITSQGSLKIGQIGMQRKGGDGGRESAKMLQFKINPLMLFDK